MDLPVYIYETDVELGAALASEIISGIETVAADRKQYLLGCPGGRSAASTYTALGEAAGRKNLDLSETVIVMMDNYVCPSNGRYIPCPDDAHYSCFRFAKEHIQQEINGNIPEEHRITDNNIWLPDPADPDRYEKRIRDSGGIDFFITASGASDGHVAFNPPGSERNSRTRIVEIANTTREDNLGTFPEFNSLEDVPEFGVTVGIDTIISESKKVALVIHGQHKQNAVIELFKRNSYDPAWPVSLIFESNTIGIYLDKSAVGTD